MLLVVVAVVGLVAVFGILVALVARRSATNKERAIGLSLCIVFFLLTACTELVLIRTSRASAVPEAVADAKPKPKVPQGPIIRNPGASPPEPEFVKRYRKDGKVAWAPKNAKTDPFDDAPLLPLGATPPRPPKVIKEEDNSNDGSTDDSRDEHVKRRSPIHPANVPSPAKSTPTAKPAAEEKKTPPPNPRLKGS